jgi:hypothetical protein
MINVENMELLYLEKLEEGVCLLSRGELTLVA